MREREMREEREKKGRREREKKEVRLRKERKKRVREFSHFMGDQGAGLSILVQYWEQKGRSASLVKT